MQAVVLASDANTFAVIAGHPPAAAPTTTCTTVDTHTAAIHHLTATASHEVGVPPNSAPALTRATADTRTAAIYSLATISAVPIRTTTPSKATADLFT